MLEERDKWRDRDNPDYVRIRDKWRDRDNPDYVRIRDNPDYVRRQK